MNETGRHPVPPCFVSLPGSIHTRPLLHEPPNIIVRGAVGSIYHQCCSCAMRPDAATSAVDTSLRVHGLQALRIVDASVFPNITSGNINAPTMMVVEKGANLILANAMRGDMTGAHVDERETIAH
ncbi:GMC oxidoreductase [Burkholderia aenigmatica]|nr:GMC oxidoreductase [Burkholderia aenigmatica]MDN7880941.1 GMC oxidoreductase [Burkholderia aenigmatica]